MSMTRPSSLSPIDTAARAQTVWFVVETVLLLATVVVSVLVWRSTNRYQDLVRREADARIAEATLGAAQANERAKALEASNLILRKDVNEASAKVASAQRDAADAQKAAAEAITRQQRVEILLARQQERAARAEAELAKLQPRFLSSRQRGLLLEALTASRKGPVEVFCLVNDADGEQYATQIKEALLTSGWPTAGVTMARLIPGPPPGLSIAVRDRASLPPHAQSLLHALATAGLRTNLDEEPDVPAGVVRVIVGHKPQ